MSGRSIAKQLSTNTSWTVRRRRAKRSPLPPIKCSCKTRTAPCRFCNSRRWGPAASGAAVVAYIDHNILQVDPRTPTTIGTSKRPRPATERSSPKR